MDEEELICDGCGRSLRDDGGWDVSAFQGWLCRSCSESGVGTIGGQLPIAGPLSGMRPMAAAGRDGAADRHL